MIYTKIESTLVITKQILNYYNTKFSQEIKSEVEKLFKNTPQNATFRHHLIL